MGFPQNVQFTDEEEAISDEIDAEWQVHWAATHQQPATTDATSDDAEDAGEGEAEE